MSLEARHHVLFVLVLFVFKVAGRSSVSQVTQPPTGAELYGDPPIVGGGESRIIGGNRAGYSQFPFQVSLQEKNYHRCGGSLIDERHVLTAAHCVTTEKGTAKKPKYLKIGVGSTMLSGLAKYQVTHVWIHKQYSVRNGLPNHDIALLRVKCCVKFSQTVQPILLWDSGPIEPGSTRCNVSGWGAEENEGAGTSYLNYVTVPVRPDSVCRKSYQLLPDYPICAGEANRDSCQGDSGGPLVCKGRLAGIVSFGIKCGLQQYPGVYTDVSAYLTWVDETKERNNAKYTSSVVIFTFLFPALNLLLKIDARF